MESWPQCYLDFIRYSLDESLLLPKSSDSIDWGRFFIFSQRQAIIGIVFSGIKRAGNSITIPTDILFQFIGYSNKIQLRNKELNGICVELSESLKKEGYDSCILKGQGNALMYSAPSRRTPGDIDIWSNVEKSKSINHGIKEIIRKVRQVNPYGRAEYHHIDYGEYNGAEVEVHYRPSFSNNLIYNRRLQKWFYAQAELQYSHIVEVPDNAGRICVPTFEFNVVFLLSHFYRHLIKEGIGLRQVIDYYYLLKSNTDYTVIKDIYDTLRYLGLVKIAGAIMWVLHKKLGMEEEYLITPMDTKRGELLFGEIMRGGNFGQYDSQNPQVQNRLKKNYQRIKRDIRLMRFFPSECLWEPVFRVYHFFWRLRYN